MKRTATLDRRALLARLGLGLGCLPLLRAGRAHGAYRRFPKRFVCVLQPHGYRMKAWLPPAGPLAEVTLPPSTSPLAPHRNDLVFLGGLSNPGYPGCERCGHGAYGTIFAGGPSRAGEGEYREPTAATVDQVIGAALQKKAGLPLPSLALQVHADAGKGMPLGGRRCFWRGAEQPVDPEGSPLKVAQQLFSGRAPARSLRLWAEQRSLLDYVGGELDRYRRVVGEDDRLLIAMHLDSLRSIEKGLAAMAISTCGGLAFAQPGQPPPGESFPAVLDLQMQLIVAALSCDITRVATLQLGDALGSGVSLGFILGMRGGSLDWHDISHARAEGQLDEKAIVDKWFMEAFARLLTMMKAVREDGLDTMLDSSVVLWASHMEDGATHDAQKVPWILAGSCRRHFKTGQAVASAGKPLHGVLAEICNAMGVPVDHFRDASYGKPMAGLR